MICDAFVKMGLSPTGSTRENKYSDILIERRYAHTGRGVPNCNPGLVSGNHQYLLPAKVPVWIHFVAVHLVPLMTGQLACIACGSPLLFPTSRFQKRIASP